MRRWAQRFSAAPDAVYLRPIIPLALALAAGISAGALLPGLSIAAAVAAAGAGAWVFRRLWRRLPAALSPLLLFFLLGYLSLQPWVEPRLPPHHISRFFEAGPLEITGVVDARPLEFESRTRFVLRVEAIHDGSRSLPVSGLLRVTLIGADADVAHGDRLTLRCRPRPIRNFNNPGGFDYRRRMQYEGVFASAFAGGQDIVRRAPAAEAGPAGWVGRARAALSQRIDAAVPFPESAVLKALVIGERSTIPDEVSDAFRRTGASHLLAISGLHFAIVASASFWFFARVLGLFPALLMRGWPRKGAALATFGPVLLYALLAGMSPSTQRALLMTSAFLLAFLLEREPEVMNTLALAALAILVVHPPSLFAVSFQLSFAAVFAIVYGLDRFRPRYAAAPPGAGAAGAGRRERLRRGLAVFVLVSVFATWGTLPLVMHYFNTVSLISLPANGLAVPLIGYAAVLFGLLGAFLEALSPEAATLCFQASGWVLTLSIAALKWMAGLPFAAVRTVTPSAFEVIWLYATSWAGIRLYLARRRRAASAAAAPGRAAPAPSPVRAAAGWLALCLLVGTLDAGYWLYQRYGRRDLRVSVLDVGQGSAVLLQLPGGHTVLVDGGGLPDAAGFDIGAAVVAPYLWREKIAAVDTMVLSHPNSDHVNGLAFIAENFKVGSLWTNGEGGESWGYRRLIETCHRRGIAVPDYASLPREFPVGGVRLERLYPPADFSERRGSDRWRRDGNNNSLVLRVVFGDFALLLPGDIMRPAERELVGSAGPGLKSRALLAPHHGSRTSSGEAFLAAAAPEAVLISCAGRGGSWPPHAEVLSRYADLGARVYRTDRHGAIRLTSDGRGFRVETELRD